MSTPTHPPQPPQRKTLRGVYFAPNAPTGYIAYFLRNAKGEVIRTGQVKDSLFDDDFHRALFEWLDRHDPLTEARSPLALVRDASA